MATLGLTIDRFRGDTYGNVFKIADSNGDPIDITGYTFKMTINSLKEPTDTATQIFQVVGTLVSPSLGTVKFAPSSLQANAIEPGTYYFDIQMTDGAGAIQTVATGKYIIRQDITKT